ncbi:glucose-1-phosphate cytidylyltransferase [Candidatus Woesebacteria bacterium]|nr:MAG: glucose-1-phosphate cytidylyltransferase [Candidatus Woesebacteria bacterium]
MKTVILAGGYGTRLSEETTIRPKPMVEIGGKPILWHIMKLYSHYGINDFIICCGFKGEIIKEYFTNYHLKNVDVTFDLAKNSFKVHRNGVEKWKVTLVDTGINSTKNSRIRQIKDYVGRETFCLTYGDGVSDVNISNLLTFHKDTNATATLTAVKSPGRFGAFKLKADETKIKTFKEKPTDNSVWINGGFMVLDPQIFNYLASDEKDFEEGPLNVLANLGKLHAFKHTGYWQNMDTLRDKMVLEELWKEGNAPWKIWTK